MIGVFQCVVLLYVADLVPFQMVLCDMHLIGIFQLGFLVVCLLLAGGTFSLACCSNSVIVCFQMGFLYLVVLIWCICCFHCCYTLVVVYVAG